ncbi:MAG: choice-of-anchor D domain-containing protein [Ktedonobacteraceae bacterium]|nr:choice-of-anchor D domain-containing protein [Ktedonobacteraceae bacterium]
MKLQHRLTQLARSPIGLALALLCILAMFGSQLVPMAAFARNTTALSQATTSASTPNPIQVENSKPGTPGWNDFSSELVSDLISGYGSKISVTHGESINFFVTTTTASVSIDIFRTGWYGGVGARKITSLGSFPGVHQPMPTPDPKLGIVVCNWTKTTTLTIPSDWVTGVYLAKLTAANGKQSFIFFVVRNDGGHEGLVFQTSVTTYQAYNTWGGTSLYNNNTDGKIYPYPHAMKVSFDRPFNPGDSNGAGHYFFYEYKFVRWMESQGYDVTYTTNVDTDTNVNPLTNHKAFLSVGHDEYWSKGMRDNVQNAISAGVNVAFFSANSVYWQIRFEANAAGVANRVEVGYKDFATDPTVPGPGPDPMWHKNDAIVTTYWRDSTVNLPENGLLGVMYEEQVDQSYPFVVQNASSWVYAGTGFVNGSSVPGIVGYEYDKVYNNGATPPGLVILGNSPVVACCGLGNSHANATLYTAPSGARVFAAGTIEWSWGLDNSQGNTSANAGIQKTTANILNNFTSGSLPGVSLSPDTLSFGNQNVNATSAAQTLTLTNNSTTALTINSIALTGTNTGDFSQTSNCPQSSGTLAGGAYCTITVTFTPTANGARTASVTVTDNAPNSPQSAGLSGTGVTPVSGISLSPTSLSFGNQSLNSASAPQAVTLTNTGTGPLTVSSIALSGTNAADFSQTNDCPQNANTLAPNAFCTIKVTFAPTANGARAASVTITDNATGSPHSSALSGTGVTPAVYFNDGFESGNFSQWNLPSSDSNGTRSAQSGVVNTGSRAAAFTNTSGQYGYVYTALPTAQAQTFTRFYFRVAKSTTQGTMLALTRNASGTNVWEVDYNANRHGLDIYFWNGARTLFGVYTSQNVISPDTWYSLELQINETSTGHAQVWLNGTSIGTVDDDLSMAQPYARLMLFDSAAGSIYFDDVIVSNSYNGLVLTAPGAALNPTSLNFGSQDVSSTSAAQTLKLTNTGNSALHISSIALNGTNTGDFTQSNDCPQGSNTLAPGAACTITVTFAPTANGSRAASVVVTDDAPNSPQSASLSGTGTTPVARVSLSPANLDFGSQNVNSTSTARTIKVTDSGGAPLTISAIALTGTNAGDFNQTNNCPQSPSTLAPGASCTITVTFTPTANGSRSASITVTDNAADSPQNAALVGTGITAAPAASLSPASLSFGNQNVNSTSGAQTIKLTNTGTAPLTIGSVALSGANTGDFNQTNNCPQSPNTLAVNAACTITVTFTPTTNGSRSASVTIGDNAADSPQSAALTGTGITSQVYFQDGFEGGDLSHWNLSGSGNRTVETSVVNSGSHAVAFTNTAGQDAYLSTTLVGGGQVHTFTRLSFRVAAQTGGTVLMIGRNANGNNVWEVDYNANRHGLDIYFWNGARTLFAVYSSQNAISSDTWYSLELELNATSTGHAQVWLNGTSIGTVDDDLSMAQYYDRLMLYDSAVGSIYFDDVIVSNAYNGPIN